MWTERTAILMRNPFLGMRMKETEKRMTVVRMTMPSER
jgi:hypothetical protein